MVAVESAGQQLEAAKEGIVRIVNQANGGTGTGFLRATGVSGRIADVVQGLLVLALLLPPAILYVRERRRAMAAASARV